MKKCKKCDTEKSLNEFPKRKDSKDGYRNDCKVCVAVFRATYRAKNHDKIQKGKKEYRENNRESINQKASEYYHSRTPEQKQQLNQYSKDWVKRNPEKRAQTSSRYYRRNKSVALANCRAYQARKLNALPCWLTAEDHAFMKDLYKIAAELTEQTGIPHHVDHIVPLQGKTVCGLHCPDNLQVIPATENLRKSNKF